MKVHILEGTNGMNRIYSCGMHREHGEGRYVGRAHTFKFGEVTCRTCIRRSRDYRAWLLRGGDNVLPK